MPCPGLREAGLWAMRLAVISDIHGNSAALDAVLDDIAGRGVDQTVNLGDSFSGPLDAGGTAARLTALDLPTVRGNHDRMLVDRPVGEMGKWEAWAIGELDETTLAWCRALPLTLDVGGVLLCHGTPEKDDENWLDHRGSNARLVPRGLAEVEARASDASQRLILCGHTHEPRSLRLPDGRQIVNPGSVGCPAYRDRRMEPNFIHQTGSPDARYALVEPGGEGWRVALISVPYDASAMIRIAIEKGAEDWAQALRSGWSE